MSDSENQQNYQRNKGWAKDGPYFTELPADQERSFQQWVIDNKVPFDPSPTADYDMRGYYQALQAGDPRAKTEVNKNDGKLHFTDPWKTPYHKSFSNESLHATDGAPAWNGQDQLVLPNGTIVLDERNKTRQSVQRGAP